MRLPLVPDLDGSDFAVLGFPFDTATSFRTGARFGPEAVRAASMLLRTYHPTHKVAIFDRLSGVDAGDISVRPGDTLMTYAAAEDALTAVVESGVLPLVIGGDHSITLAELRVLARRYGPLALIHLDAHADLWDSYFGQRYFHGTTFRRAVEEHLLEPTASIQAGVRGPVYDEDDLMVGHEMGFTVLGIDELRDLGPEGFGQLALERVGSRPAFVSFDVDVCDPAFAPGTGTPEVGGLSSTEAINFVRALAGVGLVGCDVVEVSPSYDSPGQITALLAANVVWELISLVALRPDWRSFATHDGRAYDGGSPPQHERLEGLSSSSTD
jgi:agmatinase